MGKLQGNIKYRMLQNYTNAKVGGQVQEENDLERDDAEDFN